ncbi:serine hydrolase domain-containing protein [Oenococcus alcoholitolerans]|uniref:serine hydrolase domain-containing protein n=1 Tax=Oenococcus alcoholitolerans TaxID=931074 RepID=UPI003F7186EE
MRSFLLFWLTFFAFLASFYFSAFNGLPSNSGQPIKPYHYVAPDHFSIKHRDNFAENRIQKKDLFARSIDQRLKEAHFSGSILVISKNRILLNHGYGYADRQKGIANTPRSLFGLASIQKSLTALMIFQQIKTGKISLDTTLDHYYPLLPDAKQITIHHLLTMSSGLLSSNRAIPRQVSDDDYILPAIEGAEQKYPLGSWHYSPVNYKILAGILQTVTGKTYSENFDQTFGKKFAFVSYKKFSSERYRTLSYYDLSERKPAGYDTKIMSNEIATGNVFTTCSNLYLYFRDLLTGGLLPPELVDQMFSTFGRSPYSCGVYPNRDYVRAHGYIFKYEPSIIISRNGQDAVIMLANAPVKGSWQRYAQEFYRELTFTNKIVKQ